MLTQEEAERLMDMTKIIEKPQNVKFPFQGEHYDIKVLSADGKEAFLLDVNRGRIKISKCTYQNRYRKDIVLLRLDIDGSTHTNPDGGEMGGSHLHIYREGFGDRWAFPLPNDFSANMDLITKFLEFLDYCKITNANDINLQGVM